MMQLLTLVVLLCSILFLNGTNPSSNLRDVSPKSLLRIEKRDAPDESHNLRSMKIPITMEEKPTKQSTLWHIQQTSTSAEQLQDACRCLSKRSASSSVCKFNIEDLGPIMVNGTCLNGVLRRRRRHQQDTEQLMEGEYNLHSPPIEFPGISLCKGTRPLLLVSSGNKESLHLTNVPSVWVCPGSLGHILEELIITDVPEVKIAPSSLAPRLNPFTLMVTGTYEDLIFPQRALHMDMMTTYSQVNVEVRNANVVNFQSESVVAHGVRVKVIDAQTLKMEKKSLQTISHFTPSTLYINSTNVVYMETQAAIVHSFIMDNIGTLLLKKESIIVMGSMGKLELRNVKDVIAFQEAIILGNSSMLDMSSVSFPTNANRVLISISPLRSITLKNIEIMNSESTFFCMATKSLFLHESTATRNENSPASACIKFSEELGVDRQGESGVVVCNVINDKDLNDSRICSTNPRCKLCADPAAQSQSTKQFNASTIARPLNKLKPKKNEETNFWEDPFYLGLTAAMVVFVLIAAFSFCLYKLYRRSRGATYELPQTYRNGTFPRTIITPENISNVSNHTAHLTADVPKANSSLVYSVPSPGSHEIFVSYNISSVHQDNGKYPSTPQNTWRGIRNTTHPHSSLITSEDNYSSSCEMTI